jgi:hypothetical protein
VGSVHVAAEEKLLIGGNFLASRSDSEGKTDARNSAETFTMATRTETVEHDSPATLDADRSAASRRWRSLFRIHFYAGMFAMPFILLMAFSGLVILYTQPIQNVSQRNLRQVPASTEHVSFDVLAKSVETAYPGQALKSLTVPTNSGRSAVFAVDDGSAAGRQVFVNPHTGKVLGTLKTGGGIVGLANRMHGYLNNNAIKISLPSVGALWDHGKVMRPYVVGDLVLEMLGVWTLVLVMSGFYLWWPRRSTGGGTKRNGRGLLRIRFNKTGRARWRDLHGARWCAAGLHHAGHRCLWDGVVHLLGPKLHRPRQPDQPQCGYRCTAECAGPTRRP